MTILLLLVFFVILLSFISSLSESVILSLNRAYIEKLLQEKKKAAKLLKDIKDNIDRSLSSILIINTIVNTVGAIAIGARSVTVFGEENIFYVSFSLTILILILAEIVPKSIGANYWRNFSLLTAYYLRAITFVTYPLLKFTDIITRYIKTTEHESSIREDIILLSNIGKKEGTITQRENDFIQNFFNMPTREAKEIMTPRTVMFTLDEQLTAGEFCRNHKNCNFSRIPIYQESEDNVIGFVIKSEIFQACIDGKENIPLSELKRNIRVIPETLKVSELLDLLLNKKFQLVLAVDEYGSVAGLVTLEDTIENIIGREIVDESDTVSDLRNLAAQRWKSKIMQHKQRKEIMTDPTE